METQVILYDVRSGDDIADVVRAMILQAQKNKKGVVAVFNDITFAVNPNSKVQEILKFYYSEFAHFSEGSKEKIPQSEKSKKITDRRYRGC